MTKNDKEFKRNRQILAKQDYNKAKYEKYNIKNRFNSAEKKYFVEHDKQSQYNKLLKSRYLKEAKKITKKWKKLFDDKLGDLDDLIKYYDSQFNYIPQMKDMDKIYKDKNIELYGKIEKDVDKSNIAKRLANYYDDLTGVQQFVNSYLKYIYWGAIIITIAVFIFKKQFTNIIAYPFIAFFIIFPLFFLNKFVSFFYKHMNHVQIDALYITLILAVIILISTVTAVSNLVLKPSAIKPAPPKPK